MEAIQPFGSGLTSDIPIQKYMGCTVAKFDCSADFASQPGSCSITLIQDDGVDLFSPGVIGSPQFFKIIDAVGGTIFKYNGILDSIHRDTTTGDKTYRVTLVSPLKVLEAVTVVLDGYTGYGQTQEGLPQFYSEDGYYQISEDSKQNGYLPDGVTMTPAVDYFRISPYSFATNNKAVPWNKVFNLINVFGFYENEAIGAVNFSSYGASSSVAGSMRLDKVAYALDQLINNTTSDSSKRYLGGNILYGTSTYNVCGTASGFVNPIPYYYGIDIIGFVQYLLNYLPESFILNGPSISLSELIATVCDAVNADFIVELNDSTYGDGSFSASLKQTYPLSTFGGIISILLIPRNEYVNCNKPFNQFTYDLINIERPDMGDYQFAGNVNPGTFIDSIGVGASNPLDIDFAYRGTEGSYPYGGKFPVGLKSDSRGISYDGNRAENVQVSLKATPGTVAKMVIGGYQSRMNVVPRDFIYQYWGEILVTDETNDSCGINAKSQKSIPVITQILPPNDTWDWVAIDVQSIFGKSTVPGVLYDGIYFASLMEIRAALNGEIAWNSFIKTFKATKNILIDQHIFSDLLSQTINKYQAVTQLMAGVGANVPANASQNSKQGRSKAARGLLFQKVKTIAETHYGKSWVAPVPICRTKVTSSNDNLVGNFERSWQISDTAYVEPYLFGQIEAPKDSSFISDGRLKSFVNFEHSFPSTGNIGYDILTNTLAGTVSGVYKYDFSEYSTNVVYDFNPSASGDCPLVGLAHVEPTSVSKDYIYVPSNYFSAYNRGRCPFIDCVDSSGTLAIGTFYMYTYDYNKKSAQGIVGNIGGVPATEYLESLVNDPVKKTFFSSAVVSETLSTNYQQLSSGNFWSENAYAGDINNSNYLWEIPKIVFDANMNWAKLDALKTDINDNSYLPYFAWMHTGTAMKKMLDGIYENPANDYGSGIPFVRFETNRVYYPETLSKNGVDPLSADYLDILSKQLSSNIKNQIQAGKQNAYTMNTSGFKMTKDSIYKPCVAPRSVAIPQQSNRYVYGPWMTNFDGIIYGGKFEYEQHYDLTPENYLIPVYGQSTTNWQVTNRDGEVVKVIDTVKGTVLSGIAGMNLAGQAIANSIDNFSMFAQEEGNLTLPGLPIIQKVGQVFINGPRITDLSVNFDNNQVKTTYNFRALSPRYGRNDRELVKQIRKISNTLRSKLSR